MAAMVLKTPQTFKIINLIPILFQNRKAINNYNYETTQSFLDTC
jgi:hypothetical protein